MSKHTPGPWSVRGGQGDDGYCEYRHIYAPAAASKCVDAKISEADARLIAAAPDLLAALQEYARLTSPEYGEGCKRGEHLYPDVDLAVARKAALAAIARATGGDHE